MGEIRVPGTLFLAFDRITGTSYVVEYMYVRTSGGFAWVRTRRIIESNESNESNRIAEVATTVRFFALIFVLQFGTLQLSISM